MIRGCFRHLTQSRLQRSFFPLIFVHLAKNRIFLNALWKERCQRNAQQVGASGNAKPRISIKFIHTYLQIIFPGHIGIRVRLGPAIYCSGLLFQWRGRLIIFCGRSLPVVHLDKTGFCRHNRGFGGRHQWLDWHERGLSITTELSVSQPVRHRNRAEKQMGEKKPGRKMRNRTKRERRVW